MSPAPGSATAELIAAVAVATAECTALMNEQFLALIAPEADATSFDARIAEAIDRRKLAMEALLNHVKINDW